MIRMILVLMLLVGFLLLSIPYLIIQWIFEKISGTKWEQLNLVLVQWIFRIIITITGSKVTVVGRSHLPKEQAVLYVGNHRSYFDILVGYTSVLSLTGFVAKKEMDKIPLLAQWMRMVNCLFLDRINIKEGLKTILEGIDKVKSGISIWIFPEGTRNKGENPPDLLPFKEGSLKIAEKSKCPIVPVAILGTPEIFERQFPRLKPSNVTIVFGEPIIISELEPEQKKFLGAYTQQIIKKMLIEQMNRQKEDHI